MARSSRTSSADTDAVPAEEQFGESGVEDSSVEDSGFDESGFDDEPEPPPSGGRGRRITMIAAVVVLLVGIGLGYAAGRLTPVLTAPGNDSAEAGFARDMTVHHGQAVHMAMVEYDRGQDSTLRRMAYDIATSQQYQIGVMEGWLREWRLPLTTDRDPMAWVPNGRNMLQPDGRMPGLASRDELTRLEGSTGKDADILFCQLMLRHHLGGIHMIDAVLQTTDNDRVRDLAQQMRNAQQGEIEAMREMLKAWGAQPL